MTIPEITQRQIDQIKTYAKKHNIELPFNDQDIRFYLNLIGKLSDIFVVESGASKQEISFGSFVHTLSSDEMINYYTEVVAMMDSGISVHIPSGQRDNFASNTRADLLIVSAIQTMVIDSAIKSVE